MNILVVTGGRADWGPLSMVCEAIETHPSLSLSLLATGEHRSVPRAGMGGRAALLPVECNRDAPDAVAAAAAAAMRATADAVGWYAPDVCLLLGDRYEILAAAAGAYISGVPIAHLSGGDITAGSADDAMRHAITKLASLHFPTNAESARRIVSMGEDPALVFDVGCPGVDRLMTVARTGPAQLRDKFGLLAPCKIVLVNFQPAGESPISDLKELLAALSHLAHLRDVQFVFVGCNADTHGRSMNMMLQSVAAASFSRPAYYARSMPAEDYLGLLAIADLMVGNSSSGFYEAPYFGTPVVNVGARQAGRIMAPNIVNAPARADPIWQAATAQLLRGSYPRAMPYGRGDSSQAIVDVLDDFRQGVVQAPKPKHFFPTTATERNDGKDASRAMG